jgi:hypothetical protein
MSSQVIPKALHAKYLSAALGVDRRIAMAGSERTRARSG